MGFISDVFKGLAIAAQTDGEKENNVDTYSDIPDYTGKCPDCPECGETMGYSYQKGEFKCPSCGYTEDEGCFDWSTQDSDDDFEDGDNIPWGCQVCGGPYPQCKTSCKLFDD